MDAVTTARERGIVALRLLVGWVFLWAGLEKVLRIGSPDEPFSAFGFLKFGTAGTWPGAAEGAVVNPTVDFWVGLTTNPTAMTIVNFIVPFGQVAIGAALILGIATRFASVMGFLMMAGFMVAAWDFGHGIVNQHTVYALSALILGYVRAGEVFGLDAFIEKRVSFVQRTPALRYVLG